ncbi:MAG: cadherin domain-containing protein, partial [Ekhidna sp.]|nr:cadherin domain-containing protein [Ekhidna sp.]
TVTDVNEAPTFNNASREVAEDADEGSHVGEVVEATDPEEDGITYSITGGNDANNFEIDSSTGQISVKRDASLDHEETETYTLTVTATDNANPQMTATATVTITVTDVNEAPKFDPVTTTPSVAENAAEDTQVVTVSATDEDDTDPNNSLMYTISDGNPNDDGFKIGSDGVIAVDNNTSLHPGTVSLTVTATDDESEAGTIRFNITVTAAASNQSPVFTDGSSTMRSVVENTTSGNVGDPVAATDPEDDNITYAFKAGNEANNFAIDSDGQITVKSGAGLDHEITESYTLTVTATDVGSGTATEITVTVNVNDVNETPMFANATYIQNVAENAAVDAEVVTVSATDEDDTDEPTYEISTGNTNDDFKINENTGVIAVAKALTGKGGNTYTLTVTARDDESPTPLTATTTVTINVTDVDDVLGVPSAEGVELYPNPASGYFRLTGISDPLKGVILISTTGQVMGHYPVSKDGLYDISGLNEGIFFVFIEGREGQKYVGRMVIRK